MPKGYRIGMMTTAAEVALYQSLQLCRLSVCRETRAAQPTPIYIRCTAAEKFLRLFRRVHMRSSGIITTAELDDRCIRVVYSSSSSREKSQHSRSQHSSLARCEQARKKTLQRALFLLLRSQPFL